MTKPPGDDAAAPSRAPDEPMPVSAADAGSPLPDMGLPATDTGSPASAPAEQPPPSPGDGGVIARVRRRTAAAAALPLTIGLLLAFTGWLWPGWFAGRSGSFIGGLGVLLCLLAAGVLLRRARLWKRAAAEAVVWSRDCLRGAVSARTLPAGWVKAVCGASVPLSSGRGSIPLVRRERRFASRVLPVRTVSGYLRAGQAVVVHARADGATPARGDQIQVLALQQYGPILIGRLDDAVVFAADRWSVGTH